MVSGMAMVMLAQAAAARYGPTEPVRPLAAAKAPVEQCSPAVPNSDQREIVVCAQRPQGYRLDPDVMLARRAYRNHTHPKSPERFADTSCRSVGPMGCGPPAGINLVGAALTAVEMATRVAAGKEIGSMFVTDPQRSEYQLYLEAKREREARELEQAAQLKAKTANAAAAANQPPAPK